MKKAGREVEVEEAMELEDQLHKRFKHDPALLAAMESGTEPAMEAVTELVTEPALGAVTEPVTESAMEAVMKPPETIWSPCKNCQSLKYFHFLFLFLVSSHCKVKSPLIFGLFVFIIARCDRVLRSSDLPLTLEKGVSHCLDFFFHFIRFFFFLLSN